MLSRFYFFLNMDRPFVLLVAGRAWDFFNRLAIFFKQSESIYFL